MNSDQKFQFQFVYFFVDRDGFAYVRLPKG